MQFKHPVHRCTTLYVGMMARWPDMIDQEIFHFKEEIYLIYFTIA